MNRPFLPVVAVLFAFTLPSEIHAESTDVKAPNKNQSAKFKSAIFKGSGNLIESNSIASFIGGGQSNTVYLGCNNAVIGGGFGNAASNRFTAVLGGLDNTASGEFATVSAGRDNTASGKHATVAGGHSNAATGLECTVGGGIQNTASASSATASGGYKNTASGAFSTVAGGGNNKADGLNAATVGGGGDNTASGNYATVPGGGQNSATNDYSFAAGRRAKTVAPGQFVWADSQDADFIPDWGFFNSTNTFNVRAKGGVWFTSGTAGSNQQVIWIPGLPDWTFSSDAAIKENLREINPREVLQRVASLHITEWSYKGYAQRNIGPMAQDWHTAFPSISVNDRQINSSHLQGVSLVAIQGLVEELKDRDKKIEELSNKLEEVEKRLNSLPPAP